MRARLEALLSLLRDAFVTSDGRLRRRLTAAGAGRGKDDDADETLGHAVETAYLLVDAAAALGRPDDPQTWAVAQRMAEHVLAHGRDREHGGTFDDPARDHGAKIWWVQAEALNTWAVMHAHAVAVAVATAAPSPAGCADVSSMETRWYDAFADQWRFIRDHVIDRRHGGWFTTTTRRGRVIGETDKAGAWKDPYHTARALMNAIRVMRGCHR